MTAYDAQLLHHGMVGTLPEPLLMHDLAGHLTLQVTRLIAW